MAGKWTDKEIETLVKHYPDSPTKELADRLCRSYAGVYGKANTLGLKKSPEYIKAILQVEAEKLKVVSARTRFKIGHVPYQKGKKAADNVIEALSRHWYKKGHEPHNVRPDGHERVNIEGYVELRIKRGKYVHKHRYIWEQAGRSVPPGYVVGFKDGNRLNCDLDNLHLVHRRDIMARNSIHRLPEELRDTIKMLTKIKKHIHAKEQD